MSKGLFNFSNKFNYTDVFFRDLTICLLDTLEGRIKYENIFKNKTKSVTLPIYYSLTGDDRFLLDSFQDDIVSENRVNELNVDTIPRGQVSLTSINVKSEDFRNPNIWLRDIKREKKELKTALRKVRGIPINCKYDFSIIMKTEIEIFKITQSIIENLWLYKYMFFEYNYLNIEAYVEIPDQSQIDIQRETNMNSEIIKKATMNLDIHTYFPSYEQDENKYVSPQRTKWYNNLTALRTNQVKGNNKFTDDDINNQKDN